MKKLLLALICLLPFWAKAQNINLFAPVVTALPGSCSVAATGRPPDVVFLFSGGNIATYACTSPNTFTLISSGGGAVTSVFTRTGAVTAQTGDYTVSQVTGAAPLASPTFTGTVTTAASAAGGSGFNIPQGSAPTSPNNGDIWTTSTGLFARINGSTLGPLVSSVFTRTGAVTAQSGDYSVAQITGAAPLASPTFTGTVTTAASASGGSGFNIPQGAAPTSPNNGDIWTTSTGLFARINGATVGPYAVATTSLALSSITSATGSTTLTNANNPQTWNWAQTTNSQTAMTFGETSAATGTSDIEVGISTASASTANPLVITQGSITGTTSTPAFVINTTTNNAGLTNNVFGLNVTNTASNAASTFFTFNAGAAGATLESKMDIAGNLAIAGILYGTGTGTVAQVCGGNAITCVISSNAIVGGGQYQGADNSSNGASAKAGFGLLRAGMLTNATPSATALEGLTQVGAGFLKGTAIAAQGDIVCGTTTAFTVTDCPLSAATIIGIAVSTSNPIGVVVNGAVPVSLDNTAVIGDIICMGSTTAGKGHDNGTTACTTGLGIGVVIATSGNPVSMNGTGASAITLSTSLPLVMLRSN